MVGTGQDRLGRMQRWVALDNERPSRESEYPRYDGINTVHQGIGHLNPGFLQTMFLDNFRRIHIVGIHRFRAPIFEPSVPLYFHLGFFVFAEQADIAVGRRIEVHDATTIKVKWHNDHYQSGVFVLHGDLHGSGYGVLATWLFMAKRYLFLIGFNLPETSPTKEISSPETCLTGAPLAKLTLARSIQNIFGESEAWKK